MEALSSQVVPPCHWSSNVCIYTRDINQQIERLGLVSTVGLRAARHYVGQGEGRHGIIWQWRADLVWTVC